MALDPREKRAYMDASPSQREVVRRHLCTLLAVLRTQSMSYQTSHWQSSGATYYSDHLLFQRLYESVGDQVDQLAEKIVGFLGADPVSLELQVPLMHQMSHQWAKESNPHRRGLLSEKSLQRCLKASYDAIKAASAMTLGLDDWLMAAASAHEENQYLLQQVIAGDHSKTAVEQVAPSAEGDFRPNPRREEVAQFAETGAISNVPEVAAQAAEEDQLDVSKATAVAEAKAAPPTPSEIVAEPGGAEVSTLNRYVVDSVTASSDQTNPQRMAAWLDDLVPEA
jgi:DNA-binding ferritin-like protein